MPTMLRILLIVSSLLTVGYILSRIHKAKMRIQDSIFWIIFALIAVLLAIFPQIVYWMTSMLGIESPVNFVYLVFIFLAYIKLFSAVTKISALENKLNVLAYEEALRKHEEEEKRKRENAGFEA